MLSPAQREVVQDYKRSQMEEQYAAMTAEVKARFEQFFFEFGLKYSSGGHSHQAYISTWFVFIHFASTFKVKILGI